MPAIDWNQIGGVPAQPQPAQQGGAIDWEQLKDLQNSAPAQSTQTVTASSTPWADVPGNALSNLLPSATKFAGNIYDAVRHPLDTANNIIDVGAGALHNALPTSVASFIDQADNGRPEAQQRQTDSNAKARAVGDFLKNRYGSVDSLKNTISNDPVGAVSDASAVLSGGAGLAAKVPAMSGIANILRTGATVTNPINLPIAALSGALKTGGVIGSNALGLTTGTGADTIRAAANAGFNGQSAFLDNLSGKASMTDVLDQAKDALQTMRADRGANYRAGIATTAADTTPLNFQPISDALDNVTASMQSGGHLKIGAPEANKVQEVADVVNEWKNDPATHTAMGLDALKQRLDAIYPDNPMQNQAQRAISTVRSAVKNTIVDQSPDYAKTMSSYEDAIGLEKEITRTLSLGDKASADTALRKLQSLTRNNASTNYGNRLDLANALQTYGGQDILPAISGQSMNSWMARGLGAQTGELLTGGALLHNPAYAAVLPFQSPKIVGAALYGAGRGAGMVNDASQYLASKIPAIAQNIPLSAAQLKMAANLLATQNRTDQTN